MAGDAKTLRDLFGAIADQGDRPALVALGSGQRWSHAELADRVQRLAAGLLGAGVQRGERIGLLAPNGAEWVATALAVIAAGAAIVPLDMMMPRDDLAHVLRDSGARRLFTTADRAGIVRELAGADVELFLLDGEAGRDWSGLLAEPVALPLLGPEDVAAHFYTSGTSGLPKGVPLTHRNIAANVTALLAEGLVAPDERACLPLPLFHVYPFVVGMLTVLAAGATLLLPAGVSGPEIAQALREERATAIVGVPRLFEALLSAIRRRAGARKLVGAAFDRALGFSIWARRRHGWRVGRVLFAPLRRSAAPDLRLLVAGGARLEPELAWALEGLGWEVLTGYGLTETSPIVTFNRRGRARFETAGQPLPGVDLRIDAPDEDGVGEVAVRGPNLFAGYHGLPERTAESFTEDGWFRTGDLGTVDADGYLRLTGRRSAVLVLPGGKKVDPEAVEEAYADPAIREMAVLLADGRLVAVVLPAAAEGGDEEVAAAFRTIGPTLPSYRRVTDFAIVRQPLPRTSLGKVRRFQLPDLYRDAKAGRAAARPRELSPEDEALLQHEPARRVWEWLRRRFPDKPVAMDASLAADIGIDSLDWVSLTLDLQESAGLRLTESALAKIDTVRDLIRLAMEARDAAPGATEAGALTAEQAMLLTPPGPALRAVGRVLAGINRLGFLWPFRLTVRGRANLPEQGSVLFAPNHLSFLDPFAVGAALPGHLMRDTWWAGFSGLLHSSAPRRLFSRAAQVFPVDELSPTTSLAFGQAVLERGDNLVWFPEGARSVDGKLMPFMPGIGILIERTDATVVPVFIRGSYEVWPRGRTLPRPGRIEIVFGHAMTPDALEQAGEGNDRRARIVSGLQAAMVALQRS